MTIVTASTVALAFIVTCGKLVTVVAKSGLPD